MGHGARSYHQPHPKLKSFWPGRRRWSSRQQKIKSSQVPTSTKNNLWNSVVGIIDSDVDQEVHTKVTTSLPRPEEESARNRHPTPQNPGEQNKRIPNSPSSRALECGATSTEMISQRRYSSPKPEGDPPCCLRTLVPKGGNRVLEKTHERTWCRNPGKIEVEGGR